MPARNSSSERPPGLKKFVHQAVVRLGNVLNQLAVQFLDPGFQFAGGRFLLVFATGIDRIGHHLVAQNIQGAVETGTGIHRHAQGEYMPAKPFLRLPDHGVEIHVFLVHRIHHDHFWNAVPRRIIPYPIGADAQTVLGVDHHQRKIADPQRAQPFADKVQVTGRINDVQLLASPLGVQQGRRNGNLPVLLADMVIGNRRAIRDAPHARDGAAAGQHGFAKHGLA